MEDWIDIVKERLQDAQSTLPPDDWEAFEAASLPAKRTRVLPWLLPAVAVAAAAALFVILKPQEETGTVPDQPVAVIERVEPDVPVTVAEVLPPATTPVPAVRKPSSVPAVIPRDVNEEPVPESVTETPDNSVPEQAVDQEPAKNEQITEWSDVFGSETPAGTKPRRKFSVSPHVGGPGYRSVVQNNEWKLFGVPEIAASNGGYTFGQGITSGPVSYQSWDAHHSLPLTVGLEMSYFPVSRLALTSGLDLSLYRSTFVRPEHQEISVRQQAYYLGIPFRVDWVALQAGRLSAWLGAGGKVDLCISARQGETAVADDDFNWSVMADLSLQYALTNNLGLYVQPEVSWFFKPAEPALLTYRTEHPLMVTVNAGLRIGF